MKPTANPTRPFVLPPELFKAMQYIHDNFPDISFHIKIKLNFLASNLLKHYGSEAEKKSYARLILPCGKELKPEEEQIEFGQIRNIPSEIATKIYVDTVATLFPSSNLVLSSMVKKGSLSVRSQLFRLWGERNMELNFGMKTFTVGRSSPKKPDKILDLTTYTLKWFGHIGSRYCFGLDSKTPKNHYKSFCFGTEKIDLAKDWFESIRASTMTCYISSFVDQKNKMEKPLQKNIRTQDDMNVLTQQQRGQKTFKTFKQMKEEHDAKAANEKLNGKILKKNSQSFTAMSNNRFDQEDETSFLVKNIRANASYRLSADDPKPHISEETNSNSNIKNKTPEKETLTLQLDDLPHFLDKPGELSPTFRILEPEPESDKASSMIPDFSLEEGEGQNEHQFRFSFYPSKAKKEQKAETKCEEERKEETINREQILKELERKIQEKKEFLRKELKRKKYHTFIKVDPHDHQCTHRISKLKNSDFFRRMFTERFNKIRASICFLASSGNIFRDYDELFYRNKLQEEKDKKKEKPKGFGLENIELKTTLKVNFSDIKNFTNYKSLKIEDGILVFQHKSKKQRLKMSFALPFPFRLILHYLIEPKHIKEYNQDVQDFALLNSFKDSGNLMFFLLTLRLKNEKTMSLHFQRQFFESNDHFIIYDNSFDFSIENQKVSKDLAKYLIILHKNPSAGENNIGVEIFLKKKSTIKENDVFNAFLGYFYNFSKITEFFNRKLCPLVKNFQNDKKKVVEQIYQKHEVKNFLENKCLISNPKQKKEKRTAKSPDFREHKFNDQGRTSLRNIPKFCEIPKKKFSRKLRDTVQEALEYLLEIIKNHKLETECLIPFKDPEAKVLTYANEFFRLSKGSTSMEKWLHKLNKNNFLKHQRDFIGKIKVIHARELNIGIDLFKIDYPIEFFSSDTILEKLGKAFLCAPCFLDREITSPLKKIKSITTFTLVFLNSLISPKIPLPAQNGNTLQIMIKDLNNFLTFEVSKEIILVYMVGKHFKLYGNITPVYKILSSEMILGFQLNLSCSIGDPNVIKILDIPLLKSYDDISGNRVFSYEGRTIIYDSTNDLVSEVFFNSGDERSMMFSFSEKISHNTSRFKGWIKSISKNNFHDIMNRGPYTRKFKSSEKLGRIEGDILGEIFLNKNLVWDFESSKNEVKAEIGPYILPSNTIFTEVGLLKKAGKHEKAEFIKKIMFDQSSGRK